MSVHFFSDSGLEKNHLVNITSAISAALPSMLLYVEINDTFRFFFSLNW